jgi:hypothetical protein
VCALAAAANVAMSCGHRRCLLVCSPYMLSKLAPHPYAQPLSGTALVWCQVLC